MFPREKLQPDTELYRLQAPLLDRLVEDCESFEKLIENFQHEKLVNGCRLKIRRSAGGMDPRSGIVTEYIICVVDPSGQSKFDLPPFMVIYYDGDTFQYNRDEVAKRLTEFLSQHVY